jgi:DNA-binding transcriptional MocR family regulator
VTARGDDRLSSFADERDDTRIDLRSAALPGIPLVGDALAGRDADDFSEIIAKPGYVPAGLPILRSAVADYYVKLGLATSPEQVLVTSGAQQALRLIAQAMIEPGDTVLLEEPTYRGAIEVMRAAGARLLGIPSGNGGIDLDALASATRRHRLKLILLQTTVHNPTGSVLPAERRAAVAELAGRLGITIVDHLACMDTLIDGAMPRPLAAYGADVITIGSASKAFWGGLRVGWIRATSDTIGHFTAVKSAEDLGTSIPGQIATATLLCRIHEAREYRRQTLGAARDLLLTLVDERLGEWQPLVPAGGASMWVRLPQGYSATAIAEKAARAGIDILPGPTFSSENALDGFVRIAFAVPAETLVAGIDGLAAVWHNVRSSYSCAV